MRRFGSVLISDIVKECLSGDEFAKEIIEDLLNFLIKIRLWRWKYLLSMNGEKNIDSSDLMMLIKEEKEGINKLFSFVYRTDIPTENRIEILLLIKEFIKDEIKWISMDINDIPLQKR
ncbi:conserved hypothetical protein [Methanocaldococcus vulcanius M7]|uniref:Uncharacterized protein n=1 Tax=Methanocaldococcus vulcanius (strain ATCC 700851 / DSM 12094 / M7) TaxID=579137 RepID=C9RG19_METVM|nr:hypothetical protein [Methanocaldococcus vulcanius]ACX72521.1 conserved hypothetical protein [Methanocaldococcus vulcanius M7]